MTQLTITDKLRNLNHDTEGQWLTIREWLGQYSQFLRCFFFKFLSSSESNNKSWDQLTFHTSLPNFSRTCLDILLLLINLNSDNKLLQGQFTLCVANNTLVIFSAISLSLFLLSLQPRKNDPSSSFHGFTFLEKRTIYHLSDYLPYPARVIISLIPSFSLLFFTSILNSRNLHLI